MIDGMEDIEKSYENLQEQRKQKEEQIRQEQVVEPKFEEPIMQEQVKNEIVEQQPNEVADIDREYNIIPDINNKFSSQMDEVKVAVLKDASENDKQFVDTVKENLKSAAIEHTEVEKEKAKYAKQTVEYEQEKLATKQTKNANEQAEDIWDNKQKRRKFHYDGVKPIMEFVGIKEPMNLFMLYGLTIVLLPFFLMAKLWRGTIGALIAGAEDTDRPKAVKGFLWTLLGLIAVLAIALLIYFFLKWQNLI